MVEAVHGAAAGCRGRVNRPKQGLVCLSGENLYLDPGLGISDRGECLGQGRDRLSVRQGKTANGPGCGRGDGAETRDDRVVMHDQASVVGGMDIELNPIRTAPDGVPERLE